MKQLLLPVALVSLIASFSQKKAPIKFGEIPTEAPDMKNYDADSSVIKKK